MDILADTVIRATLDAGIESWLDRNRWDQRDAEIERARDLLVM
jgi:hypothetical protein